MPGTVVPLAKGWSVGIEESPRPIRDLHRADVAPVGRFEIGAGLDTVILSRLPEHAKLNWAIGEIADGVQYMQRQMIKENRDIGLAQGALVVVSARGQGRGGGKIVGKNSLIWLIGERGNYCRTQKELNVGDRAIEVAGLRGQGEWDASDL